MRFITPITQKYIDYAPKSSLISLHKCALLFRRWRCRMYVVVYYIVFAMRNESTIGNSEKFSDIVLLFIIAMHDPTIYLIWPSRSTSNVYRYKYGYRLPLNLHSHESPWLSRLERQSSILEVVGSNPAVGKNFSFCNSRSLRVADTSNQSIQMKSTVTYT